MSFQPKAHPTPQEYLALERKANFKSEYLDGEIFAMSGASRKHNVICLNVGASLNIQLTERPCEVYVSDMRVKVNQTGLYTYPDVVAVCDAPIFEDEQLDTLLNPTLIVEVLSKSTRNFDRGEKFEHYRTVDSFEEYLLIAQDKYYVEHYVRQADRSWMLTEARQLSDTVHLPSINCDLTLAVIYHKVKMFG